MERSSRLPRMWPAMFKRVCVFIIPSHFNHRVLISSSSSPLPALSPQVAGWARAAGLAFLRGGHGPVSWSALGSVVKAKAVCKK